MKCYGQKTLEHLDKWSKYKVSHFLLATSCGLIEHRPLLRRQRSVNECEIMIKDNERVLSYFIEGRLKWSCLNGTLLNASINFLYQFNGKGLKRRMKKSKQPESRNNVSFVSFSMFKSSRRLIDFLLILSCAVFVIRCVPY